MRKFYSFLGTILLGTASLFAQTNYTCTFSANVTLDSVQVKNTVSGEAKMLYSPDNLITLRKNGETAIATVGNSAFLQKTANNVVAVNVETASQLNLVLYSISGIVVARYSSMVNAGQYSFQIGANAGVYVLVASAGDQSTSVKLSLTENSPIGITEITTNEPVVFLKSATDVITFNQGDVFEFTGYYQKQTDVKTAVITENKDIEFHFGAVEIVNGAIKAPFSVAEGKQVYFSMGNLQFNVKQGTHVRADGTTKPGTWRFAENQWDFVGTQTPDRGGFYGGTIEGSDNINLAWNYDGWIDLFSWGTSGNTTFPYSHYGVTGKKDIAGTNNDWGLFNPISNGGNAPGLWRTLTIEEYEYILRERENAEELHGFICVNGVNGFVLFPDNWKSPSGLKFVAGIAGHPENRVGNTNVYSLDEWLLMQANGAVFFPAGGHRDYSSETAATEIIDVNYAGFYWSASSYIEEKIPEGASGWCGTTIWSTYNRREGCSVRLVQDVE